MASRLKQPLQAFRIGAGTHPVFDGAGAMLHGARWNSPGRPVIYASLSYAGALLEILVHASGIMPRELVYIEIELPAGLSVEHLAPGELPGWDAESFAVARQFGDRWLDERRSAVLVVPSVVTRVERNILIDPGHKEFGRIHAGEPRPVLWDKRLWGGGS